MPKDLKSKPAAFIPVNAPVISEQAKKYVQDCLDSGWISSAGPYVEKFEKAFAQYIGMKHAVAVSSGTAALHCALLALDIKEGDEVIVPAFTMIASIFAILYTGAKPVFVDCERRTLNLDTAQLESKITARTKAVMPVHLFGHACEMDAVLEIARRRKLKIIEDAAEAHGALYKGRKCGTFGDISCFSFYANKIITTGEGGMTLTQDDKLAARLRKFRDLCHSDQKRFIHESVGFNYRLTSLQAAVGCGELENIERYIEKKIAMAARYRQGLAEVPGIQPLETLSHVRNVYWMFGILVNSEKYGMNKDALRAALKKAGVDTRDFFYPPVAQPALAGKNILLEGFPNTEWAAENGCYLPSGLAVTPEEIHLVTESIRKHARPA